jgi:hypothetical protein
MAERKRQCKRKDSSDTHVASEGEDFFETDKFLAESMRCLTEKLKYPRWKYASDIVEGQDDAE